MSGPKYLLCEFCGAFYLKDAHAEERRHDQYPDGCAAGIDYGGNISDCYSCCGNTHQITSSQRSKHGPRARCVACIEKGETARFKKFDTFMRAAKTPAHILREAVAETDVEAVERCLSRGYDPNMKQQLVEFDEINGRFLPIWNADGSVYERNEQDQPTTPLKLVVFRLSDCTLKPEDFRRYKVITQVLLDTGGDRAEAVRYAKYRFGEEYEIKLTTYKEAMFGIFSKGLQECLLTTAAFPIELATPR
ncbi:hypothetical protein BC832DRAFT_595936 [Gaertneriomyces semiglobifer]|nr:hypothetical protein BC832DRAFT_595936 [Gaertneriomyces semiglobifer]